MVISGGLCVTKNKVYIGGCGWSWWACSNVKMLDLNIMTLSPKCESVETKEGVALTVTGIAQVAIRANSKINSGTVNTEPGANDGGGETSRDVYLKRALEQFAGQSKHEIERALLLAMEGHLRGILGTMTVEEIYREREQFADKVMQTAAPEFESMGMEIVSFVIQDVTDDVGYLESLGKTAIADMKKDADVGTAVATRDVKIRQAECTAETEKVQNAALTAIANSQRDYETQKASFDKDVNERRAQAELAYNLQASKVNQLISAELGEIDVVERKKQIEIESEEVLRKDKELIGTINRPAEANRFKVETLAEGSKEARINTARGEAEAIKMVGSAEASKILAIGEAEAEAMRVKAEAFKTYGDAAITEMILNVLPTVAREAAKPLENVDDIVLLSGGEDGVTSEVTKLITTLPPVVQAVSGVDLKQMVAGMAGTTSNI